MPDASTPTRATAWRRFLGLNIKGTPSMPARDVAHDLAVAEGEASVFVLQEFKWPWYWRTLAKRLPLVPVRRWRSAPRTVLGLARPGYGAQAVVWRGRVWKRRDTMARLLHMGEAGITETRYVRAVLLADKRTGLAAWFGTTHFVVGGDEASDGPRRRAIMANDLAVLSRFLDDLAATGMPVVFQLDANIRPTSAVYPQFRRLLRERNATVHGHPGVEYLFTMDGTDTHVEVHRHWTVPVRELRTDHEGRGITFRLVEVAA